VSKMREKEREKRRLSLIPIPFPLPSQGRTSSYAKSRFLEKLRRKTGGKSVIQGRTEFDGRNWVRGRKGGKILVGKGERGKGKGERGKGKGERGKGKGERGKGKGERGKGKGGVEAGGE
jgi:hypothetical protein